jgi:cytochrome c
VARAESQRAAAGNGRTGDAGGGSAVEAETRAGPEGQGLNARGRCDTHPIPVDAHRDRVGPPTVHRVLHEGATMQRMLIAVAAAGSLVLAGAAQAATGEELFKSKGCVTCHAPDVKKVGPSLKDIQAKNKPDAIDRIAAALKDGKGHPKTAATEAEIKQMVTFAVTGK